MKIKKKKQNIEQRKNRRSVFTIEDHDLLIRLDQKVDDQNIKLSNHIKHSTAIVMIALTAGLFGAVNMIVGLILILVKL